ncbi:MAG: CPBP family intramembrane glutamic endopeptidase [Patescibacteria group bacterium]
MKENVSPLQKSLNVWAIILILWSIYRANFGTSLPTWLDEFLVKPLFFILPVFWYIKRIEKKPFFSQVDLHKKTIISDLLWGGGLGVAFFTVGYMGIILKQGTASVQILKLFQPQTFIIFAIAFATSVSEEILSRGFVLKRLYEESKNAIKSIAISSLLFFFLHIPILFTSQHMTGTVILQVMMTDIALSVVVSVLYLQRRSLLLPIIIHAFYTFSLTFFLS